MSLMTIELKVERDYRFCAGLDGEQQLLLLQIGQSVQFVPYNWG